MKREDTRLAIVGVGLAVAVLLLIWCEGAKAHLDEPIETVVADAKGYWLVGVELDRSAEAVCLSPAGTIEGPYYGCTDLVPGQTVVTIAGVLAESVDSFQAQAVALDAGHRTVSLNAVEVVRQADCVDPVCPVIPMCPAGTTTVCVSAPE